MWSCKLTWLKDRIKHRTALLFFPFPLSSFRFSFIDNPIVQACTSLIPCLSRDTSVTPYTRPPVSTDSTTRDRLRDCRNLRQIAVFHHIPPHSTEFCQVHRILPSSDRILPSSARTTTRSLFCPVHVLTKQLSQRYIPFSPCSLTFSPYATSWLHHTVYVRSLIISTSLYIIDLVT